MREPPFQKNAEPGARRIIVDRAIVEMGLPRPRAGQFHAVVAARGPAMHHRMRHVGMKLQRESPPGADRLHFERIALGEEFRARRHVEPFAVPLIDTFRPGLDHGEPGRCRPDRVIADFGMALRMAEHLAAELPRQHLGAEADTEIRLVLPQRHRNPVGFAADEIGVVVGAHRPAKNNGGLVLGERRRQRIAEARAADVEAVAQLPQRIADAARRGILRVQNCEDRLLHGDSNAFPLTLEPYRF